MIICIIIAMIMKAMSIKQAQRKKRTRRLPIKGLAVLEGVLISGVRYGPFSKCHVFFCGLDSGNLKYETVRTNRQHTCF